MSEYKKLALVVVAAITIDVILQTNFIIVIFLLIYIISLIYKLNELENFFTNINIENAPNEEGRVGNIVKNILKLNNIIIKERQKSKRILAKFNEVIRNFPYPTIVINEFNQLIWIDRQAAKIFGLRRKSDIGIKITNIIRNTELKKLLSKPEASELQIILEDEIETILSLSISKKTKGTRIIGIRDVSSRVKLIKLQQEFIANASHELRTPLTVINGYLETLKLDKTIDDKYQEIITEVYKQGLMMTDLVNDLLDLSSLDNKNIKLENVNFAQVIKEVKQHFDNLEVKHKIILDIDNTINIYACFYQIYIMVKNLIDNSIKYSPSGSDINVKLYQDSEDYIIFVVTDKGIGIEADEIENIMEPFYRVNNIKKGSGLGLNIVQKIANNYGAEITIESEINKGSSFIIRF